MSIKKTTYSLTDNVIGYLPVVACTTLLSFSIFHISKFRDLWYIVPATFLIEYAYNKRWQGFSWHKTGIYYIVILIYFILYFAYYPFEDTFAYHSILLRNRIALLGLSIVGILGLNAHYHKLSIYLHTLIITSLLVVLYLLFFKIGLITFLTSDDKTTLFMMARINHINSHMMFNLYLNIALISIWYILSKGYKSMQIARKIFYLLCYLLFFYILNISEGRSGFFMSLFLTGFVLFIEFYKRNKTITLGIVGLFVAFVCFKITFHPRVTTNVSTEPRIFLWENAFSMIKEKPILGWGANSAQSQFTQRIWQDTTGTAQTFWLPTDFVDSHNQYIQAAMEFGIVGLFFVLIIYFAPYFLTDKRRKMLCLLFFIVLAFQSMFDMFITGQFASLFMIVTFMFLMSNNDIASSELPKSNK